MKRRRFIAGAVCPDCGAVDRLVVDEANRRCVSCGYSDARPSANGKLPATRITRRPRPPGDARPVRLIDD